MRTEDVERLVALAPGERAWFWLCPAATPPLLVRSVRSHRGLQALRAHALSAERPVGTQDTLGVVQRGRDGRLIFSATGLQKHHLSVFAAEPRLAGAVLVTVSPEGAVLATHQDAAPPPRQAPEPASLAAGAWVWLGRSFLWTSARDDPDGRLLARQAVGAGEGVSGFVDADNTGALRISTSASPWTVAPLLPEVLARAWVVQLDAGRLVRMVRPGGLDAVLKGAPGWFWFTDADRGGAPLLVVDLDEGAVLRAAAACRGKGRQIRGAVRRKGTEWLHFQAGERFEGFVEALRELPIALPAARLTVRDADGTVVERQR